MIFPVIRYMQVLSDLTFFHNELQVSCILVLVTVKLSITDQVSFGQETRYPSCVSAQENKKEQIIISHTELFLICLQISFCML